MKVVRLSLKRKPSTDEWKVNVFINGKYDEDATYYTDDKEDAKDTMKAMKEHYDSFPDTFRVANNIEEEAAAINAVRHAEGA